jgi:hypothetical protein
MANPAYWRMMCCVAQSVTTVLSADTLISGGAALSDHIAVRLFLDGDASKLVLNLPAEWTGHGFRETSSKFDTGRTSNWYHSVFSKAVGIDSLRDIQLAIEKGATVKTGAGGFKERNTDVANESDSVLAFTFGNGAQLKDGGTKDTWDKFGLKAQREWDSFHKQYEQGLYDSPCGCTCNVPSSDWFAGYHFALPSRVRGRPRQRTNPFRGFPATSG